MPMIDLLNTELFERIDRKVFETSYVQNANVRDRRAEWNGFVHEINNLIEQPHIDGLCQCVTRVLSFVEFQRNSAGRTDRDTFNWAKPSRTTYGMTFSLLWLVDLVISTRVISALRRSRTSNPSMALVMFSDCSVDGITWHPPLVLSGSSSKLIFPRWSTAATVL